MPAGLSLLALLLCTAAGALATTYPNLVTLHPISNVDLALRQCGYSPYASTVSTGSNTFLWQVVPGLDGSSTGVSFRPLSSFSRYLCVVNSTVSSTGLFVVAPTNVSACTFEEVSGLSDSAYMSYMHGGKYLMLSGSLSGPCAGSLTGSSLTLGSPSAATQATWYINNASFVRLANKHYSGKSLRHCNFAGFATTDDGSNDFQWYVIPGQASNNTNIARVSLQPGYFLYMISGTLSPNRWGAIAYNTLSQDFLFEIQEPLDGSEGYVSIQHVSDGMYMLPNDTFGAPCTWLSNTVNVYMNSIDVTDENETAPASWMLKYIGSLPSVDDFDVQSESDDIGEVSIVTDYQIISLHPLANLSLAAHVCSTSPYVSTADTSADYLWQMTSALDGQALPYVSLRPVYDLERYLCVVGSELSVIVPTNNSLCVFKKTTGLASGSTSNMVTLMFDSQYLTFGTLGGSCSSSVKGYSMVLSASPASSNAVTWFINDASTIRLTNDNKSTCMRHCYYKLYACPKETTDDQLFTVVAGLDSSYGANAVSFQSVNYPALYLGPHSTIATRVGTVDYCSTSPGRCTFLLRKGKDGAGSISLYHPFSRKYIGINTSLTGDCTSYSWVTSTTTDVIFEYNKETKSTWVSWTPSFGGAFPGSGTLKVPSATAYRTIDSMLYGAFFEEINFAGDGGLYAEMLWNRDFEALGRGILYNYTGSSTPVYTSYLPWFFSTSSGSASASVQNATSPYSTNPWALGITATAASTIALKNPGYWGVNCRTGIAYKGSLFAKASTDVNLSISLKSSSGASDMSTVTSVAISGSVWKQYNFTVTGVTAASDSWFVIVASLPAGATLYFDSISLFPGDAVEGLFRKDVFEPLKKFAPAFLRFPGGNYLEGYYRVNRWNWKNTIGNVHARSGHYNDAWGYWTNDGLGLYEYHILCGAIGATPLMSIYTGYSMTEGYVALSESDEFAQAALDAIEYANGLANTTYGKIRADAGHSSSFELSHIEVGNEESDSATYATHYGLITNAVWAKYPDITVVASGRWGASMTGHPCTSTSYTCQIWDDHYYRTPSAMAAMSTTYDSYSRSTLPKVFVGEYAANSGGAQTVQAAVAEASFMIGFERNADAVVMASFAPLFRHTKGTQWSYDMINFNSSNVYLLPSYFVQQLFRQEQCSYTLQTNITGSMVGVACVKSDGTLVIKAVNYEVSLLIVKFDLGVLDYDPNATMIMLTGGSLVNTLDAPDTVSPTTSIVNIDDGVWMEKHTLIIIKTRVNWPTISSTAPSSAASTAPSASVASTTPTYSSSKAQSAVSEKSSPAAASSEKKQSSVSEDKAESSAIVPATESSVASKTGAATAAAPATFTAILTVFTILKLLGF